MKVIIAGSRHFNDYKYFLECISNADIEIDEIVSGGATGVDEMAERYAEQFNIPIEVVPANWGKYGLAAGPIRNREMAEIGDVLIAIKTSGKGTQSMIREARLRGKGVIEYH